MSEIVVPIFSLPDKKRVLTQDLMSKYTLLLMKWYQRFQ